MKIFLASGGSGGHLFPAIDVADELQSRGHEVVVVGSFQGRAHLLKERHLKFIHVPTLGFNRGKCLSACVHMLKAVRRSSQILKENQPDVVIGFGGHGSFALVFAAVLRALPTVIHEQNVKPGKANRWLSGFVNKVAVSFEGSARYFKKNKTYVTGCPTHLRVNGRVKQSAYSQWNFLPEHKTILVFGGSQGAHRINSVFIDACQKFKDKAGIQVLHICGDRDYDSTTAAYQQSGVKASVHKFLTNMEDAYQISDLVISRAGALTVTELSLFGKQAVLIPYPHAGGHQHENAKEIENGDSVRVIREKDLTPESLRQTIECMLLARSPASTNPKRTAIHDSSKRIADLALGLV